MKVIVYTRPEDGGVSVDVPGENLDTPIEEHAQRIVPAGIDFWIVEQSEIPENREYRNAWTFNPGRAADGKGERL